MLDIMSSAAATPTEAFGSGPDAGVTADENHVLIAIISTPATIRTPRVTAEMIVGGFYAGGQQGSRS